MSTNIQAIGTERYGAVAGRGSFVDEPVMLKGLQRWPRLGDVYEIDGELWRVVALTERGWVATELSN